ncbi:hypothetical protein EV363DRAFT_1495069 [Boletus edulis]|nr:hypothetical protein EV363DRAFT_1495069 [Boletus edulis]
MSETLGQSRKRKYRSDGPTPTWVKRTSIDGPGVWASCVKGKEKQTVGELYDLFESLATELWPVEGEDEAGGRHASEDGKEDCFPIDPVKLIVTHAENVRKTGAAKTKYTHRLIPVAGSCVANLPEIHSLCRTCLCIEIATCMPQNYVVDLNNPDVFVLVEVFKSVCGMSILRDYYKLHKFNVMMLANEKNAVEDFKPEAGRVQSKQVDEVDPACVASK